MENINNINKMSKEAKTSYLKDPKIRKEYLLPQNHYEFIWLVQELKNEDILSFLDENMTNMLENDTKLEGKLNAIINCGNPQVNDYLKNDKVIEMINTFPDLEIYLSSLNLNFGQRYFNYITKNNHLEKFANLGSNIQLEIVKNINNLKLLKTIPIANTFLSDISIECASYLIKDPYFENIFLNQDIFEIDRMVKKGLVIPNHLITNKLISKYIGIQDVNIFYNIMTNLETNNPYLKQVVKKQMTKKYHTIINNVDPNLGIFSEYKDLIEKTSEGLSSLGMLLLMIFFASQFISIFKETNIPTIIVVALTNFLKMLPLSGLALLIISIVIIAIANIFMPTSMSKWTIISPVMVPMLMQLNISPQFSQFIFRAAESMTNGITPLLAYFVVYLGYLNIYNKDKEKSFGIRDGIKLMMPYFIWMTLAWILIIISWYLIGLPLGPKVYPTL